MPTAVGTGKRRKRDSFESYPSIGYFLLPLEEREAENHPSEKTRKNGGFSSTGKEPRGRRAVTRTEYMAS